MEDAGSDPTLVKKALVFADAQTDVSVKNAALRALGRTRNHDSVALDFMRQKLRDSSPYVRKTAVDTVGRLVPKERAQFVAALTDIALNPEESKENRSLAQGILNQ
jgi:HEAT repeat protein